MRDWIDKLSGRSRAAIIAVVFALTVFAMMDDPVQLLVEVGKDLFEMAVAGTSL
jgi:hypothetical protein